MTNEMIPMWSLILILAISNAAWLVAYEIKSYDSRVMYNALQEMIRLAFQRPTAKDIADEVANATMSNFELKTEFEEILAAINATRPPTAEQIASAVLHTSIDSWSVDDGMPSFKVRNDSGIFSIEEIR